MAYRIFPILAVHWFLSMILESILRNPSCLANRSSRVTNTSLNTCDLLFFFDWRQRISAVEIHRCPSIIEICIVSLCGFTSFESNLSVHGLHRTSTKQLLERHRISSRSSRRHVFTNDCRWVRLIIKMKHIDVRSLQLCHFDSVRSKSWISIDQSNYTSGSLCSVSWAMFSTKKYYLERLSRIDQCIIQHPSVDSLQSNEHQARYLVFR